jgi:hypothetical protein
LTVFAIVCPWVKLSLVHYTIEILVGLPHRLL